MNSDDEIDDREGWRLSHVESVKKRRRAGKQRQQPDERVTNSMSHQQPITREDSQARKDSRRDFGGHPQITKPGEGHLKEVKQQVMVYIVFWIERSKRKPAKGWWKVMVAQRFPEHAAPLDVVVAVEIAAANG